MSDILKATHEGPLTLGEMVIPCAVLEDGTRVLSERGVEKALGKKRGGADYRKREIAGGGLLPIYLSAKSIKAFISEDLMVAVQAPVIYTPLHGGKAAHGLRAEILPQICEVWLKARDAGALQPSQLRTAEKADMLIRGLARVGIIALVDEATGYQESRDKLALQGILDAYLRKELAAWAKRFPDEFYKEMFRLRGWKWKGMSINRPSIVGTYTNDLVYERLAPSILSELERKNPKGPSGKRRSKHHQWLTDEVGHPALAQHIHAIIGFMRASNSWKKFYELIQRAFPKKNEQFFLPIDPD